MLATVHANTIPAGYLIHGCTDETRSLANLQDLIPMLASLSS